MTEVVRLSVEVWESDPETFCYNRVGYMALVGEAQAGDIDTIHQRQQLVGY